MTSRTCEEYNQQENGKQGSQEDEVRRRKKTFQREVSEENAPEENGTSNRLFPATFIPPLTFLAHRPSCAGLESGAKDWCMYRCRLALAPFKVPKPIRVSITR